MPYSYPPPSIFWVVSLSCNTLLPRLGSIDGMRRPKITCPHKLDQLGVTMRLINRARRQQQTEVLANRCIAHCLRPEPAAVQPVTYSLPRRCYSKHVLIVFVCHRLFVSRGTLWLFVEHNGGTCWANSVTSCYVTNRGVYTHLSVGILNEDYSYHVCW